ncbi:MAG: hypothetical protein HOP10_04190 [Chitinophagaceae bacterium]|nr:hypothetical protein [Chitinophagaceae bacterium]
MPVKCSDNKNPLMHSGSGQLQRLLKGLQDDFVNVDERSEADWLVYARNYASFIKYFNSNNAEEGNWKPFFETDISAQLAVIAVQDVEEYRRRVMDLLEALRSEQYQANETVLKEKFGLLFSLVLSLAKQIDILQQYLPEEILLKATVQNLVQTRLVTALKKLSQYYSEANSFTTSSIIKDTAEPGWQVLGEQIRKPSVIVNEGLSDLWLPEGIADWSAYKTIFQNTNANAAGKDFSIYGTDKTDVDIADVAELYLRINHAANHNLFTAVFDEFLKVYSRIVADAAGFLKTTLTNWPAHLPHYALFLSFINLFKTTQKRINSLTHRHLDFYYKDILRLAQRPAEPNHVHVFFELAKHVDSYLLPKNSLFKAGKDSLGKEVLYSSDNDIVINKTKVTQVRSFFKATAPEGNLKGVLYASPVANSADGNGKEIKTESGEWHPFVNKKYVDGAFMGIEMPQATIGFAVASHYLCLGEGERKIYLRLYMADPSSLQGRSFSFSLTTEKGWYAVTAVSFASGNEGYTKPYAQFTITIPADAPPIVAYAAKVHAGNYATTQPLLKIDLLNIAGAEQYNALKSLTINSIKLTVTVGEGPGNYNTNGIKTLLLQNDAGVLDPAKPFLPFGIAPKAGSSFIIGNKEAFQKKNAQLRFSVEWVDMKSWRGNMDFNATDRFYPTATIQFLENGVWVDADYTGQVQNYINNTVYNSSVKGEIELFWGKKSTVYFPSDHISVPADAVSDFTADYKEYSINSRDGFLKLELNDGFQHDEYQEALVDYMIRKANKTLGASETLPQEPYTPKIKTIYLSYTASVTGEISSTDKQVFDAREIQFFHTYPFGQTEQHAYMNGSSKIPLMPPFTHDETDDKNITTAVDNVAEFYIGLTGLKPSQIVNILFQVLEGSTDPQLAKPTDHVHWSYMSNNNWKKFDKLDVADNTNQLVQSGIISFNIPDDATTGNEVLPPECYWLKASVSSNPESVCKLVMVVAQAAQLTFLNKGNADDFLKNALPANTISKLKEAVASVKKITQPFSSFGGRQSETDKQFYTRVSERLRHKDRAITIWDYEHMVLEKFPGIHKVKCLNHTWVEPGVMFNEIAPGHVSIITIPTLFNKNAIDPLRPYTNRSDLENIRQYLQKHISCHVKLHVENPEFEEVRVEMKVKFFAGIDETFYSNKLKDEITQFLTPWAFQSTIDIEFGGKVVKSAIIDFVEERSYVDFITDVKMFHDKQDGTPESDDLDEIIASRPWSILVSAPAKEHSITVIKQKDVATVKEICLDDK